MVDRLDQLVDVATHEFIELTYPPIVVEHMPKESRKVIRDLVYKHLRRAWFEGQMSKEE